MAFGFSKKLRFQSRGQLNKLFSKPTYQYTNLRILTTFIKMTSLAEKLQTIKTAHQMKPTLLIISHF